MRGARLRPQAGRRADHDARHGRTEPSRFSTWWRTAGLLGWAVTAVGVAWGLQRLDHHVRSVRPAVACTVEWVNLPPWLTLAGSEPIRRDLDAATRLTPDTDVYDPGLCRRVGEGLSSSPWVAEVHRIAKQEDGRVRIAATFREPFALVEVDGIAYLIDREGVRLPQEGRVELVEDHYWNDWFRLVGVSGALPSTGEVWPGDDLQAGLRLIAFLREATVRGEVPFRSSLRAVDVGNFARREDPYDGQLRIRTIHPASYINWGLPPHEEYDVEPPATRKLAMLRAVYADQGQLPDDILDVRSFGAIKRGKLRRG